MTAYYNENDPFAAAWLRQLTKRGLIPDGEVDERSIVAVCGDELRGFNQCHFFAGIGGWPCAGRLAGIPDDYEWWTGSCPCQSLSIAGKQRGHADERHLWPAFYRLIAERRPAVVAGEQVASADAREWFSGVRADLEDAGYACGAAIMPASAVGAPHRRERLFWAAGEAGRRHAGLVAHAESLRPGRRANDEDGGRRQRPLTDRGAGGMGDSRQLPEGGRAGPGEAQGGRTSGDASGPSSFGFWSGAEGGRSMGDAGGEGLAVGSSANDERRTVRVERTPAGASDLGGFWSDAVWFTGADGKTRRVGCQIRRIFDGFPSSLDQSGNGRRGEEEEIDGEDGDGLRTGYHGQRSVQPSDVARLLSSEMALGQWEEGIEETVGLQNLREAVEGAGFVPQALSEVPQIWRSMSDEARQLVGRLLCARGLVWEPTPLLTAGQANRAGLLRGLGNAIVPQLAAAFLTAATAAINGG